MALPASAVVVCEANKTRADLYGLWLDEYGPRRALTAAQFADAFDAGVAVLVLDESFGDGAADEILETARSEASHCRVLGIRERSTPDPEREYDRDLERPVFEADLVDRVETLFHRANYHLLLDQYYRTTVLASAYEYRGGDDATDGDPTDGDATEGDRYERLLDRAERLRDYLNRLRQRMRDEDVRAVAEGIAVAGDEAVVDGAPIESKYRPDECAQCGRDWTERVDGDPPAVKIGAYVWRCEHCGHVDMRADPNHRNVTSTRR